MLHQAERLRDGSENSLLLPVLVNLNSLVAEHICAYHPSSNRRCLPNVIALLVTTCSWDKFYVGTFASQPNTIHLSAYTRDQVTAILVHYAPNTNAVRYARFVDLLLTVCLPVTRNIGELLYMAQVVRTFIFQVSKY